jgi:hypothetical protein
MAEVFSRRSLAGATFYEVDLRGVKMRGVNLRDGDISGAIENLRINGIDVAPLIEAEMLRQNPEWAKMRPTDAEGFREAWDVIERLWSETVRRAEGLDPALLREHVNGEWSFIETLRHLVFATDAWICRVILGDPSPWDPLDLPWDEMPDVEGIPRDREVRPSLEAVLSLRADRMARVRSFVANLTDDQLARTTEPVAAPGWPPPIAFPVRDALGIVVNEEWWHRQFAERDLRMVGRP